MIARFQNSETRPSFKFPTFFIEAVTLVGMCGHIEYTLLLLVDSYAWNEIYNINKYI
jgi:hypothetical protein